MLDLDDEIYEQICNYTGCDYKRNSKTKEVTLEELNNIIYDLVGEIEERDWNIFELKNDIENYYEPKKFDSYEEYGLNEENFH